MNNVSNICRAILKRVGGNREVADDAHKGLGYKGLTSVTTTMLS